MVHGRHTRHARAREPRRQSGTFHRLLAPAPRDTAVHANGNESALLRKVVADAPVAFFAVDADGIFTLAEGKRLAAVGLEAGEVVGRSSLDHYRATTIVCADGNSMSGDDAIRAALDGRGVSGRLEIGASVFDFQIEPQSMGAGEVPGAVGMCTDASARARLERAMYEVSAARRQSEMACVALLDTSIELVCAHRHGHIVYANVAMAKALRYDDAAQLAGMPFLDLVHSEDRALVEPALASKLVSAPSACVHAPGGRALRLLQRDGSVLKSETVTTPFIFEGRLTTLVIAADVTERDLLREQWIRADRLMAMGTLAAGVAHEINNPLAYALLNVELVLRRLRARAASSGDSDPCDSDHAESLAHALDGIARVRGIVHNLMTFASSNIERCAPVDVRGLLESAVQMALHEIRSRAKLVRDLAEVAPIDADETRLGQAFFNLLVNAAQSIPETNSQQHEVRVTTRMSERGEVVVEFADTGVGIAPEALPRIFDPFFSANHLGARKGLGLSIAHGIIEALGGEIQVESTLGKGSVFRVVLPAAKTWRPSLPSGRPATQKRRRVLIVEEDALVAEAIARTLAGEFAITTVGGGREALALLGAGERYHALLTDLMMSEMSGLDFYAEMVRIAPDVIRRVVFMTAGVCTPQTRAFLKSVGNHCIEKPFDAGELRRLIRTFDEADAHRD